MRGLVIRGVGALAILVCLTFTAEAHRLKLFATVENGVISGYGFFIGGGRPSEAQLLIRNGQGIELFRGPTASDGSFTFKPGVVSDFTLTMDAGDGHIAEMHISADRFPLSANDPITLATPEVAPNGKVVANSSTYEQELAILIDRSVDRAVSRQIMPLLEAYAEADGRVRFNDVVSGIAVIFGMAGLLLWGSARRRGKQPPSDAP